MADAAVAAGDECLAAFELAASLVRVLAVVGTGVHVCGVTWRSERLLLLEGRAGSGGAWVQWHGCFLSVLQ